MSNITLTEAQEKAVNDCREWLTAVYNRQNKWLSDADLWTAYPYKRTGMNQHGFNVILKALKTIYP